MRDKKQQNEFHIIVGGQKLEEIRHRDDYTYISMPLFHKVSYGSEYTEEIKGHGAVEYNTQKWPVCPYTVAVRNLTDKGNFAQLFVDGQKVATKYVNAKSSIIFEGVPTDEGIQELLFALPRFTTLKEKNIGGKSLPERYASELGSVKIVWRDCVKTGTTFTENYRTYGHTSSFKQANKDDAGATGGATAGAGAGQHFASSTRAGKVIGMDEARACAVTNHQYVGQPWEARLLYRTQDYLENIGVIAPTETKEDVAERKRKRARKRASRKLQDEANRGGAFVPPPVFAVDAPPPVPTNDEDSDA
ncbi:unnamed protein product [Pylaiella littoralis]